jgi:hypothetical protein
VAYQSASSFGLLPAEPRERLLAFGGEHLARIEHAALDQLSDRCGHDLGSVLEIEPLQVVGSIAAGQSPVP